MRYKRKSDGALALITKHHFYGRRVYYHAVIFRVGISEYTNKDIVSINRVMPEELKSDWEKVNA